MVLPSTKLLTLSNSIPSSTSSRNVLSPRSHAALRKRTEYARYSIHISSKWLESGAKTGLSLAAAILLFTARPAFGKEEIFGRARVVDGDTLVVNNTRIRMFGIDAPETKQSCSISGEDYSCGIASKEALDQKIGGAPVRCAVKNKDMYGRSVAICKLDSEGLSPEVDLNSWMVSEGWAVAYKRYSPAYVPLEATAQQQKKGIWAGTFELPDQWRKEHPRNASKAAPPPPPTGSVVQPLKEAPSPSKVASASAVVAATSTETPSDSSSSSSPCLIKGNISAKGEKLYHVPGGRYYEPTKINESKGERYFCSEEEALAAGWRAAKV